MSDFPVLAGLMSTTLFVASYLPMLYRAITTRDLRSYSRPSLVLANVGNGIQSIYVYSLPTGPIWFLHGFYLGASALMLGLHLRHLGRDAARNVEPVKRSSAPTVLSGTSGHTNHQGEDNDGDPG